MKAMTRLRFWPRTAILAALLVLSLPSAAFFGSESLAPSRVLGLAAEDVREKGWTAAIRGWTGVEPADSSLKIFFGLRLPRVLLAGLIGAALATAGTAFQATLRNPLADPFILGISGGGCLGAVAGSLLFPLAGFGAFPVMAFAFVGAVATLALVFALAGGWRSPEQLILTGVVVNALHSAAILFLSSLVGRQTLAEISLYLMGRLESGYPYVLLFKLALPVLAGVLLLAFWHRRLNLLALFPDDETASLGVDPRRARLYILVVAALLTGTAVAFAGPIGFVGLIIPHTFRLLWGSDHRLLIPASALGGAFFLIASDTAARSLFASHQIPVGVITAVIGGTFFLALLARNRRRREGA